MKVLVSAYACEPHKGSEPGVGWNWAKQIAKFAEVWVITRANNRFVIEDELRRNPVPDMHFSYYDVPKWLSVWKKKTRGLYLYYFLWQIGVYGVAKKMHKQKKFDAVHHLTFGNLWLPTFLPLLGIPFVWGPVGGGEKIPNIFRMEYKLRSKIIEFLRDNIIGLLKFNLLFKAICKKANTIITKTTDTAGKIPNIHRSKVIVTADVAISQSDLLIREKKSDNITIITVGRLDAWRGFDLLLRAYSTVQKKQILKEKTRLVIIGNGPDKKRLVEICRIEHLNNGVIFTGNVERIKYLDYMSESTIFVNPSLKEGGVTVLFDALAFALPVICMDIPGASEIITEECGIKIKPTNPEQTINDLTDALLKLAFNLELREKIGKAGRKRVSEHYTWEKKGKFIKQIYEKILNNESTAYS